jgi:hypothetical protein
MKQDVGPAYNVSAGDPTSCWHVDHAMLSQMGAHCGCLSLRCLRVKRRFSSCVQRPCFAGSPLLNQADLETDHCPSSTSQTLMSSASLLLIESSPVRINTAARTPQFELARCSLASACMPQARDDLQSVIELSPQGDGGEGQRTPTQDSHRAAEARLGPADDMREATALNEPSQAA